MLPDQVDLIQGLIWGQGGSGRNLALSAKSSKLGLKERGQPAALLTRQKKLRIKSQTDISSYTIWWRWILQLSPSRLLKRKQPPIEKQMRIQSCYSVLTNKSNFQPNIIRYAKKQETVIHIQGKEQKPHIKLHVVQFCLHGISR